jgi:hypothetical protein
LCREVVLQESFPLTRDTHDGMSFRHTVSPSRIRQQFVSGGRYQRSPHPVSPARIHQFTLGGRIHSFPGANSPIHVGRSEVVTTVSPARINQFTLGGQRSLRDVVEMSVFLHDPRRNAGHGVGNPDPVDRRSQERVGVELEATLAPRPTLFCKDSVGCCQRGISRFYPAFPQSAFIKNEQKAQTKLFRSDPIRLFIFLP